MPASPGSSAAQLSWHTGTDPDRDPLLFLAHLVCALQALLQSMLHQLMTGKVRVHESPTASQDIHHEEEENE